MNMTRKLNLSLIEFVILYLLYLTANYVYFRRFLNKIIFFLYNFGIWYCNIALQHFSLRIGIQSMEKLDTIQFSLNL